MEFSSIIASGLGLPDVAGQILLAMILFMTKHLIADFYLQTTYQVLNKGTYFHPGGILHSAIHVIGSAPIIFYIFAPASSLLILLLVAEFIIHYHLDWCKERIVHNKKWTTQHTSFWIALGTDQFLHQITYVLMIVILIAK
mgnify:CR=1 FL=1